MAIKKNSKSKLRLPMGAGFLHFKGLSDDFEYSTYANNVVSFSATASAENEEIQGGNGQPIFIKTGATNFSIEANFALLEPDLINWLEGKVSKDVETETVVPETTNAKVGSDGKIVIAGDSGDITEIVDATVSLQDLTLLKKVTTEPQSGEFQIDTTKKALVFNEDMKGQDVVVHAKLKIKNVRVIKTTKTPVRPEFKLYFTTDYSPQDKANKVRVTTEFLRVTLDQPISMNASNNTENITLSFKTLSTTGCETANAYERDIPNEVC